jgi:hypothetical protein
VLGSITALVRWERVRREQRSALSQAFASVSAAAALIWTVCLATAAYHDATQLEFQSWKRLPATFVRPTEESGFSEIERGARSAAPTGHSAVGVRGPVSFALSTLLGPVVTRSSCSRAIGSRRFNVLMKPLSQDWS